MHIVTPLPGDNTQQVQDALDAASLPTGGFMHGSVRFDGEFSISSTLITGRNGRAPCIEANAVFKWRGAETSDYLLRYAGEGLTAAPRITGSLWLDCRSKCRGLMVYHQAYAAEFAHILVRDANEIAVDLIGCWGSWVHDLVLHNCHGIAVRMWGHNTARVDGVRISGTGDAWSDPADESVRDWRGRPVQTSEADRGLIVVGEMNQLLGNAWNIEGVKYSHYPLLSGRMDDGRVCNVRVETCQYADLQRVAGSNNEFDNWIVGT